MPLVYVLCTNKKTATYKTIFEQIKRDQPNYQPLQMNLDFEMAAINATKSVYPTSKIQLCNFHLKQSVLRNLASKGMKERYETELKFSTEIRQLMAIAYLPEDQVSLVIEPKTAIPLIKCKRDFFLQIHLFLFNVT